MRNVSEADSLRQVKGELDKLNYFRHFKVNYTSVTLNHGEFKVKQIVLNVDSMKKL